MRLKKITLSGFKSFAKTTNLELPAEISAIVGPNGSGKSNVVEGIQWALGEQSFKNLRGKKSEDFIFNGSASAPKMGKASVSLIFDPQEKKDVLGYDEVNISRRVYRDGVNEYLINNSHVRLKDVMEILSKFGLGASSHHIISQGESDRILSASSKEKREMLEDALGLKIYQLRRQEAERKLKRAEDNINQVESLRKEIQPHLKFLKKQAEKVEKALDLRNKLKDLCQEYFSKEENFLNKEFERLNAVRSKPLNELESVEERIKNLRDELEKEVPPSGRDARISNQIGDLEKFGKKNVSIDSELAKMEKQIEEARLKRLSLERDLGKCEGMIELQEGRQKEVGKEVIEKSLVLKFIEKISGHLKEGFLETVFEKIKKAVDDFSAEIKIYRQNAIIAEIESLKKKSEEIVSFLEKIRSEESELSEKLAQTRLEREKKESRKRDAEREIYSAEITASNLRNHLKSFELQEEKLKSRKEELELEKQSAEHFIGEMIPRTVLSGDSKDGPWNQAEMRREIERLKIRLEDSEGVGDEVLKEYQQVKTRDDFFSKELGDLGKAAADLVDLIKELSEKIDYNFQKGVLDINKEFQNFFTAMFGGGTAELKVVKVEKRKPENESEDEERLAGESSLAEILEEPSFVPLGGTSEGEGIEISVNIPRKRIKSLDMLSGGERALTSIALLFAMTQVNPPPFLVLDETDAALDESNSQKYAKMLKDLSKRTQLILVTHNRETMKQAGILYGVTMGNAGVSQILSIKFEEAEELAEQDKT